MWAPSTRGGAKKNAESPAIDSFLNGARQVHLGWLVVWGNIFGGLIGFISSVAGAGQHL